MLVCTCTMYQAWPKISRKDDERFSLFEMTRISIPRYQVPGKSYLKGPITAIIQYWMSPNISCMRLSNFRPCARGCCVISGQKPGGVPRSCLRRHDIPSHSTRRLSFSYSPDINATIILTGTLKSDCSNGLCVSVTVEIFRSSYSQYEYEREHESLVSCPKSGDLKGDIYLTVSLQWLSVFRRCGALVGRGILVLGIPIRVERSGSFYHPMRSLQLIATRTILKQYVVVGYQQSRGSKAYAYVYVYP